MKHSFGSDNHSGVHEKILNAISKCNQEFQIAYGEDEYTKKAELLFKQLFGDESEVIFVFNGTGANVLSLFAANESFNAIICPSTAHIYVDECGAPEKITGAKLIPVKHNNGKIDLNALHSELKGFNVQHHSQIKTISISQPTEFGTLYTPDEIRKIADIAHSFGGYLHIDGARIANASASLNLQFKSFTADCGVDIVSFGGTKNGLLFGEAVVLLNKELSKNILYKRKHIGQLFSKSRFIAAQFIEYLSNNLYFDLATHSNLMAKYLAEQLLQFDQVKITRPVETNGVFAIIPPKITDQLIQEEYFYIWDESINEVRLMCSFTTTKQDIDKFIETLRKLL
ncbi:Low specificity L-threonine aldolase [bioreactor metagenome]|jgi:threonine aldolase|uniref:Low specificity L-threonine aldolase n=1 Tax=bioreactor metagenome TaxID=1076179 RepID=A0A644ZM01_9ZZZZ